MHQYGIYRFPGAEEIPEWEWEFAEAAAIRQQVLQMEASGKHTPEKLELAREISENILEEAFNNFPEPSNFLRH